VPDSTQSLKLLLDQIISSGGEAAAITKELAKALSDVSAAKIQALRDENQLAAQIEAAAAARERQLGSIKASAQALLEEAKETRDAAIAMGDKNRADRESIEVSKAKTEALKAERDAAPTADERRKLSEDIIKQTQETERLTSELDKQAKSFEEVKNQAGQFADNLIQIGSGDILGGLKNVGKQVANIGGKIAKAKFGPMFQKAASSMSSAGGAAASGAGGFSAMASSMAATVAASGPLIVAVGAIAAALVALAVVVGIGVKITKLAVNVADMRREFEKTTGSSYEFSLSIAASTEKTRLFGASVKDTLAASQSLSEAFTDFNRLAPEVGQQTAVNATLMTKLGMSAGDVAKSYQNLNKSFNQTAAQSDRTMRELQALSQDIGIAPAKMASDFAGAGPQLAKFGSQGVQAFKDLAVASKVTGFEVSRLLSIVDKFDTFDGAAEQAGKLNAALGGNFVNAMELVTETDPVGRFNMIRDSILDAGKSFDTMSYYERKFFTEAAGLQDVGELALMLKGDMDSLNGEIGKNSASYEEAAKRARNLQSFQESLTKAFEAMIPVITPLVEFIEEFGKSLTENVSKRNGEGLSAIALAFKEIGNQIIPLIKPFTELIKLMSDPAFGESSFAVSMLSQSIKGLLGILKIAMQPIYALVDGLRIAMLLSQGKFAEAGDVLKDYFLGYAYAGADVLSLTNPVVGVARAVAAPTTAEDINAAATGRAAAPVYATNNAMSNAVTNATNSVSNTYHQQGLQGVKVIMDGRVAGRLTNAHAAREAATT
jgi:hypothetical protein